MDSTEDIRSGGEAAPPFPISELAAQLRLVLTRLRRRLRAEAGDELSPTRVAALVSVERHGPLTLGRLAELERVTPPSITRVVAALDHDGLIVRETDRNDRRVSRVAVTTEGARLVSRARTHKAAYLARGLQRLDDGELATVRAALPVLERLLRDDA